MVKQKNKKKLETHRRNRNNHSCSLSFHFSNLAEMKKIPKKKNQIGSEDPGEKREQLMVKLVESVESRSTRLTGITFTQMSVSFWMQQDSSLQCPPEIIHPLPSTVCSVSLLEISPTTSKAGLWKQLWSRVEHRQRTS